MPEILITIAIVAGIWILPSTTLLNLIVIVWFASSMLLRRYKERSATRKWRTLWESIDIAVIGTTLYLIISRTLNSH